MWPRFRLNPLFRYIRNGLLAMLDRNVKVKPKPQKFQKCEEEFDVIICLEERVYDQVGLIQALFVDSQFRLTSSCTRDRARAEIWFI